MSLQSRSDYLMSLDWVNRHLLFAAYPPRYRNLFSGRFSPDELLFGTKTGQKLKMGAIPLHDRQMLQLTMYEFFVPRAKRQRQTTLEEFGIRKLY
jgi:hypothetical protein